MFLRPIIAGSLLVSATLLIASCGLLTATPDSLTFSPAKGDTRLYDIYTRTFLEVDGPWGTDSLTIDSNVIVDYEVLGSGRQLHIAMQPEYFWMKMGGRTISSFGPTDHGTEVVRELMESGFEFFLDARSGELKSFTSRNEVLWQAIQREAAIAPLIDQLEQQMAKPGALFPEISLTEGETVTVEEPGELEEVALTTRKVTGTEVIVDLEGKGKDNARIAGVMVLERDTGWIRRLALYTSGSFEAQGNPGRSRQLVVMIADGAASFTAEGVVKHADHAERFEGWAGLVEGPRPGQLEEYQEQSRQTDLLLPADTFGFSYSPPTSFSGQPYLDLEIDHAFHPLTIPGSFDITDLELTGANGEVIPIRFHEAQTFTGFYGMWPKVATLSRQVPLGWNIDLESLESLQRVTARGTYLPALVEPLVLPLDPHQATEVTMNGARARAVPTGEPGEFELYLEETETHWFSGQIYTSVPVEAATLRGAPHVDGLDKAKQELFYMVGHTGKGSGNLRLNFTSETPDELVAYVVSKADAEAEAFELTFIHEDELYQDLDRAPTYQGMKNHGTPFYLESMPPDLRAVIDSPPPSLGDIHLPETAEDNTLSLTLPEPLAGICELDVVDAPDFNNTRLVWYTDGNVGDEQDDWSRTWHLETEGGAHFSFYDISVTAEIRCPSIQGWHVVELDAGERPWLVDVTRLPGDPDLNRPMTEFISQYRFFGSYGWELPPLPLEKPFFFHDYRRGFYGPPTLAEYLVDGRWLRIAGKVERAEYLALGDEPEVRRWTVQFPPSP